MSRRRTGAIAIGVGAATALVLSLTGAKTPVVIGSAAALGIAGGVLAGRKSAGKRVSTEFSFSVQREYKGSCDADEVDSFNTFEEALKCFQECIKNPDEDDDSYELALINLDENGDLVDDYFDEYEVLLYSKGTQIRLRELDS